jgi:hypothetical protein
MKRLRFNHVVMIALIALSAVFFVMQLLIFHEAEEAGFLFFQDLMFLPLHVVLVTFILDRILHSREKQDKLQQIHIVISAFFSETGSDALREIGVAVPGRRQLAQKLDMKPGWCEEDFAAAAEAVKGCKMHSVLDAQTLHELQRSLPPKKAGILQLFSNPNLLEHDKFTDMLWALYHLIDELENREDCTTLPKSDMEHLAGDITRAFGMLTLEWVQHMKYLKGRYPYLWSIAVRKNPFADNSIIVK